MSRSTKTISLILMGSVVALVGCKSRTDEEKQDGTNGGHRGGMYMIPRIGGGGVRTTSSGSSTSVSSRGGFGGSGSASVGS